MNAHKSRRNIAVFIDLENMFGGYGRNVSGVPLSRMLREVHAFVESLEIGSGAATTRAYANWTVTGMSNYRRELLESGVEPVQIFSTGGVNEQSEERRKNAADIQIVVDALSVAVEAPWVDVFVIVSGDGDYLPLVRRLQYLGKYVIGVTLTGANAGGVSAVLRSNVDHYFEVDAGVARPGRESTAAVVTPATKGTTTAIAPQLPSDRIPSLAEYVKFTRDFVATNPKAMHGDHVDGVFLNDALRRQWPRVTFATFGFATLGKFVEVECGLKIYRQPQPKPADSPSSPVVPTSASSPPVSAPVEATEPLRNLLEAVEPAVLYPKLVSLESVLDKLTVQYSPLEPDVLLDNLGNSLPDVAAEQIRLALGLLYAVGAFRVEDDLSLMLTSDVNSVQNGIDLVLGDARRRAQTIEIDPEESEIQKAVFG